MRRISISGLLIVGLMALGIGLANSANAAASLEIVPGGIKVDGMVGPTQDVVFCIPTATLSNCQVGSPSSGGLFQATANDTYLEGSTVTDVRNGDQVPLPAGTYVVVIRDTATPGTLPASRTNVVIGSGGGGGDGISSDSTSQPQTLTLSINTVDGSSCSQSSVSGIAGSWIDLPAADSCTPPVSKAAATLLGWATNPNFPVEIAQRQINNGWGAYQMFDDEERLTAVFIPAGGPTLLSGDGNLFAIWSE